MNKKIEAKLLPLGTIRRVPLAVLGHEHPKDNFESLYAPTPKRRRRRNTVEVALVYPTECCYSNGEPVTGLWEAISIRWDEKRAETMVTCQNGWDVIEIPQRCCRGVR